MVVVPWEGIGLESVLTLMMLYFFFDKKGGTGDVVDEGMFFMKTLNKSKFSREEIKKKIRES